MKTKIDIKNKTISEMTLGERLYYLRTTNKKKREDLVEYLQFENLDTYAKYERDNVKNVDIKIIINLAKYYNVSTDYILTGTEIMTDFSDCKNPVIEKFGYIFSNASDNKKKFLEKAIYFINSEYIE